MIHGIFQVRSHLPLDYSTIIYGIKLLITESEKKLFFFASDAADEFHESGYVSA